MRLCEVKKKQHSTCASGKTSSKLLMHANSKSILKLSTEIGIDLDSACDLIAVNISLYMERDFFQLGGNRRVEGLDLIQPHAAYIAGKNGKPYDWL